MKKYTIPKGKHSSRPRLIKPWIGRENFKFKFELDESCWYPSTYVVKSGISKICGVSFGTHAENPLNKIKFLRPLINSVIVGWMPDFNNKNKFNLYIINDNRGTEKRPMWVYEKIEANTPVNVFMKRYDDWVNVNINGISKSYQLNAKIPFGYYLGFYHGGYDSAYHTMNAKLKIN